MTTSPSWTFFELCAVDPDPLYFRVSTDRQTTENQFTVSVSTLQLGWQLHRHGDWRVLLGFRRISTDYLFTPASQFVTTVMNSGAPGSFPASLITRNRWPSGETS